MANTPGIELDYLADRANDCGDCGKRRVELPASLPEIGDDFDWNTRDYDGFRLFMLEELAARFQERRNWKPADMEVVLVETLAVVLDQLSDMLDRVQGEAFLETARRPESVRRLLSMIGYDAIALADFTPLEGLHSNFTGNEKLDLLWNRYPHLMAEAKLSGPASIHQQQRMVTLQDYEDQLSLHPLVLDASAYSDWSGSWTTHHVVVSLLENKTLDEVLIATDFGGTDSFAKLSESVDIFHHQLRLRSPDIANTPVTGRNIIRAYLEAQRMAGQEVVLQDAIQVGIVIALSIRISEHYYRSEIVDSIRQVLGDDVGGFFEPGILHFGDDLFASDIIETTMALDGIESVCLNRFKRVGKTYGDQADSGRIILNSYEIAVCKDLPGQPEFGSLRLALHGGIRG